MTHRHAIENLRNVAIIAHVDHGKTTLIDGLLRHTGMVPEHKQLAERAMDTNDLERERGITIVSKCTSITYRDHRINIVDTPGHADFGGEVERVLAMVDSVLLLVDAFEGPMPQTRFVLNKALQLGLNPIVVINKIDRPDGRPDQVLDLVFDLFVTLGANDRQLEFPVVYASAKRRYAVREIEDLKGKDIETLDLTPLLDSILENVPHPPGNPTAPLRLQIATLQYSDYLGRLGVGRVYDGVINEGDRVMACRRDGTTTEFKISKLYGFSGLDRIERSRSSAGEIVVIAGISDVLPGETICALEHPNPLPLIAVDEPTISMRFSVNNGPFCGQDGKFVTSRHIKGRLERELEQNVALRVEPTETPEAFSVMGRGELHLSILIETMRREGYELLVGRPRVVVKEVDGQKMEPIEELVVEMDDAYAGSVIEELNKRRGEMQEMQVNELGTTRLRFLIPSRGLIGFRSGFLTSTRGTGVMYHTFHAFGPYRGDTPGRASGALIVQEAGETTGYALANLQERGTMFMGPGEKVYMGQLVGLHVRENDLVVNPCKKKQLTNMRASGSDDAVRLTPPIDLTLERALETIGDDEVVEVTPLSIRVRKVWLDHNDRKRYGKKS